MSTKNVNGKLLYSLEEVSYQFITHDKNKDTMYKFIDAMTFLDVIDRVTVRYNKCNKYHYVLTDWFKELIKGHYYTDECIRKGKKVNGTLYFDGYASIILERLYLYYVEGKIKPGKTVETVYKVIAYTAPDFIEPIIPTDEPEFIENIDYPETLLKQLQEDMTKGITHVKRYKKEMSKEEIKEICDKCFDGWYSKEECEDTQKRIDDYLKKENENGK